MIRYDMIEEFNVNSKAECNQLNLAHRERGYAMISHPSICMWLWCTINQ